MKSMRNTTGLGSGAGVVVSCRFPVTLSAQSGGFGAGASSSPGLRRPAANPGLRRPAANPGLRRPAANPGLRRPAANPTHPLSLLPFTKPIARHSREGA
jgi:hypothetical protein